MVGVLGRDAPAPTVMRYDPLKHHRRSTRVPGFDYAPPGAYFVTVCVHGGSQALGKLIEAEGRVHYRLCGNIITDEWKQLPYKYAYVTLDEYVVMPDHFHGLLWFAPPEAYPVPRAPLGAIIGFWKHQTTRLINEARLERWGHGPTRIWQRGFYDRIVPTKKELAFIRQYIRTNPQRACNP